MLVMIVVVSLVLTGLFIAVAVAGNRAQGRLEVKRPKPRSARSEADGADGEGSIIKLDRHSPWAALSSQSRVDVACGWDALRLCLLYTTQDIKRLPDRKSA